MLRIFVPKSWSPLLLLVFISLVCSIFGENNDELVSVILSCVPLLLLAFTSLVCTIYAEDNGELASVFMIMRHGDRAPDVAYPNDPYKDVSNWPEGFGQLSKEGKQQQFQLGQWLRKRYDGFLADKYSSNEIYVLTTDVDRTHMSAQANLAGLYPPEEDEKWNPDINWQPIPVHTIPYKNDFILFMTKPCKQYDVLYEQLLDTPEFVELYKEMEDLFQYLTKHTGGPVNTLKSVSIVYDTLKCESHRNFTLPTWTESVYPDKLRNYATMFSSTRCYNRDLARLRVGPLLNHIVHHFSATIEERKGTKKFRMYSGHDSNIVEILQTLNILKRFEPPYASCVLLELRRKDTDYFINVLYKNGTVPYKLKLENCDVDCPFDKFVEIVKPFRLTSDERDDACHANV